MKKSDGSFVWLMVSSLALGVGIYIAGCDTNEWAMYPFLISFTCAALGGISLIRHQVIHSLTMYHSLLLLPMLTVTVTTLAVNLLYARGHNYGGLYIVVGMLALLGIPTLLTMKNVKPKKA